MNELFDKKSRKDYLPKVLSFAQSTEFKVRLTDTVPDLVGDKGGEDESSPR